MRVVFQNDAKHKCQPQHYPQVGTIGEAFFPDKDQDELLCVQWPPRTTSLDDCWYCDTVDVRILPEGSADAEVTSESGGNIVHCFECRYYGGGETCRCNHPQLCFDVECYDQWLDMQPDDFCSRGEKCK